jgi:hypothetical protein
MSFSPFVRRLCTATLIAFACIAFASTAYAQESTSDADSRDRSDYVIHEDEGRIDGQVRIRTRQPSGDTYVTVGDTTYGLDVLEAVVDGGTHYRVRGEVYEAPGQRTSAGGEKMDVRVTRVRQRLVVRQVAGSIDLYSARRNDNPKQPYAFFTKNDGPVVENTHGNLMAATSDFEPSQELLMQSKKWERGRNALMIAGGASLGYGIFRAVNLSGEEGALSLTFDPFILGGLATAMSAIIPHRISKSRYWQAIQQYNENAASRSASTYRYPSDLTNSVAR